MGKGALRPFFKGHSLKKEKEHEKKEVDKMLSHFVTLPFLRNDEYVIFQLPVFPGLCRSDTAVRPSVLRSTNTGWGKG